MEDKIPGYPFFGRIGSQTVSAGQVNHFYTGVTIPIPPSHFIHGYTGVIGDMLPGTGQGIKHS